MESVGTIIVMGSISVACAITEKVLISMGKSDTAQMVNIAGISSVGITAVTCVVKVFSKLKELA